MSWPVYNAKARFSEFLDQSLTDGPQIVSRRGVDTAVLVSIDEWNHLQQQAGKSVPDPLLDPAGPRNIPLPARRPVLGLRPVSFGDNRKR